MNNKAATSVEICNTINILLDVMKMRGHRVMDDDNPDFCISEIKYDSDEDRLYFVTEDIGGEAC